MSKTPEKVPIAPPPYDVASPSAAPVVTAPAVAEYPAQQIPLPYPAAYPQEQYHPTQPSQIVIAPTAQTPLMVIQQNPQQQPQAQQQIDSDSDCCCDACVACGACCLCLKVCNDCGCCCCCKIIFKILSVMTVLFIIALICRFTLFS